MRRYLWSALMVVTLTGCTSPSVNEAASQPTPTPTPPDLTTELKKLVEATEEEFGGEVGVAIDTGHGSFQAGDHGEGSAWSTIKVPIAIAADREEVATQDNIKASIKVSDNPAAAGLWVALGDKRTAASKVEELLEEYDSTADVTTIIETYSGAPFGNSIWPVTEQATFATHLPCMEGAENTYSAMADIAAWQMDGLGNVDGARFKGGWSRELIDDHTYTYRQFGTIPVGGKGVIGVAIIAYPEDGDHDTAAEMLGALAEGIAELEENGDLEASTSCVKVDGHYHPR